MCGTARQIGGRRGFVWEEIHTDLRPFRRADLDDGSGRRRQRPAGADFKTELFDEDARRGPDLGVELLVHGERRAGRRKISGDRLGKGTPLPRLLNVAFGHGGF
jgi:hypothetical protein